MKIRLQDALNKTARLEISNAHNSSTISKSILTQNTQSIHFTIKCERRRGLHIYNDYYMVNG